MITHNLLAHQALIIYVIWRLPACLLIPKLSDFSMSLRENRGISVSYFEIATHPSGSRNDRLIKQLQEK